MIHAFRKLFVREKDRQAASVPEGERVYAVGDVHGRSDLLGPLIKAIEADDRQRGPAQTTIVLLGDLVDRGPDSRGVLELARIWQRHRKVHILCGNHEEMFERSFEDLEMLRHFLRHGGRETLQSYGIKRSELSAATLEEAQAMMCAAVPDEDRAFIRTFEDMVAVGDYLFVHAGIAPGIPFEEQRRSDLRWIREPFLSHKQAHGALVVHGHTIYDEPEECANRIGIDTGAYSSGILTTLVLEGSERRFIAAIADEDGDKVTVKGVSEGLADS